MSDSRKPAPPVLNIRLDLSAPGREVLLAIDRLAPAEWRQVKAAISLDPSGMLGALDGLTVLGLISQETGRLRLTGMGAMVADELKRLEGLSNG